MLGLTRRVRLGLTFPVFEMGEEPELSGTLAVHKAWGNGGLGRGEGAAWAPPGLRGGSAHERRGRRGPGRGGAGARARARASGGTERACVQPRRRQLLWDPAIRPAAGSSRPQPSPPRAPVSGLGPGPAESALGRRKGRGPGRGAVTHTRAEGGARVRSGRV